MDNVVIMPLRPNDQELTHAAGDFRQRETFSANLKT
jgi:hypothetical protein